MFSLLNSDSRFYHLLKDRLQGYFRSMIQIRKSKDRGHADHGWLNSQHTFSFSDYHDPKHMGFSQLRVINEDRVQPGQGFGRHGHQNMEIISYVLEGALEHKDSLGTGSVIRPGDVQRMSAGTGVQHSEFNHSKENPVHFLQIWIQPEKKGIAPGYEEKRFTEAEKLNRLRLIVSRNGEDGSLKMNQDAKIYASVLQPESALVHELPPRRHTWIQVARGEINVNGVQLLEGDGAAVSDEEQLSIRAKKASEFLIFDLP